MIEVQAIKTFHNGTNTFTLDLDLHIEKGSFTAISGVSGVGKTTLLRMIAGLEQPDSGSIKVNGATWYDASVNTILKPQQRKVGMVFQSPALFPNMSVRQNLAFADGADTESIDKSIAATDIKDLLDRKPDTLSGGQKQRVALARALAQNIDILLLDEPLSALDATTRYAIQQTLITAHKAFQLTTLLVTHDISEMLRLADHAIILENGKVVRSGPPQSMIGHERLSGKFQFQGELIEMKKEGVLFIGTVLIGQQAIQVIIDRKEAASLNLGDKVIVASKAFNPIVKKLTD